MTVSQKTFWRWPLYFIYALFIITLFLYLRFPTQEFKTFCTDLISQHLPGYENSIESLHYRFPLTLVVRNLQLQARSNTAQETFAMQQINITPDLAAPGTNFSLAITAYGGTHRILLELDRADLTFTMPKIEIEALDLTNLSRLKTQTGRTITGLFTDQGSYAGQIGQDISLGVGEGSAQLTGGTFELLETILSLNSIDLKKGEALFKLQDQKLLLSNGKFNGKEMTGTFSGQISSLNSKVAAMQLEMTGALTPLPALTEKSGQAQPLLRQLQQKQAGLPFKLKGTISKPVFLFDS
ncbi:MAG: type II secretion system protein GspN [Desulfobulbaceae bacterium]